MTDEERAEARRHHDGMIKSFIEGLDRANREHHRRTVIRIVVSAVLAAILLVGWFTIWFG